MEKQESEVLMGSGAKIVDLSGKVVQDLLGVAYLETEKSTNTESEETFKKIVTGRRIFTGKGVIDLVVGYKDNFKHVFFVTNTDSSPITVLRKDAVTALTGDPNVIIAQGMKVTINGREHIVFPAELLEEKFHKYNILGDDFTEKNCNVVLHNDRSPRTIELEFFDKPKKE